MTQQTVGVSVGAENPNPLNQEPFTEESAPAGAAGLPPAGQVNPGVENPETFTEKAMPPDKELPSSLEEIVQRSIELRRENRDLKNRMDANAAEINRLDPIITEQFARRQIQSQKRTTGETIYIEKSVYASLVRDDDGEHSGAHQALREHGLEWLVRDNVNSNALSAYVREQRKLETEIPEGLLPFLKISEVYRVKVRQ